MAKPEHVKCENCISFEVQTDGFGRCRRNPPSSVLLPLSDVLMALGYILQAVNVGKDDDPTTNGAEGAWDAGDDQRNFPLVRSSDWCGDFRAEWPA